ncbi:hypothetical protein EG834_19505, partial [bacterium]|nr:hypothetical protein [bacterium]
MNHPRQRIFRLLAILMMMMPTLIYGQSGAPGTPAVPDKLENYRIVAVDAAATSPTVELPLKATNPNPPDGATGQPTNPVLSWSNGGGATSYDIYFGRTNAPNILLAAYRTETTFNLNSLVTDADYYWRVDSRNAAGKTTGDVWQFITTAGLPGVSVTAIDSSASEPGTDTGTFRFARTGSTSSGLDVS